MRTSLTRPKAAAALVLSFGFVTFATGQANASCLNGLLRLATPGKASAPAVPSVQFVPAVYRLGDGSGARFWRVGDWNDGDEPIVGLWEFTLYGGLDFGTQAWHADGTELMFSAGRDPATGDICQGVWRKIGPRTYSLNHIAMGYDNGFAAGLVRVHLHAVVKVDRFGKTFSGTIGGIACTETAADPFHEGDNCMPLPTGPITGTWVKPD